MLKVLFATLLAHTYQSLKQCLDRCILCTSELLVSLDEGTFFPQCSLVSSDCKLVPLAGHHLLVELRHEVKHNLGRIKEFYFGRLELISD